MKNESITAAGDMSAGGADVSAAPVQPSPRFLFIDGLRGIASLAVVIYHLGPAGHLAGRLNQFVPVPIVAIFTRGGLGVAIFFVLSGFVIAYSQRGARVTARYFGNFAFRRCLRLDPPYWITIAFILILNAVLNRLRPERQILFPGTKVLLAHLLYLQNLLHYRPLSPVFWTLCFEVQFYLAFLLATGLAQRIPYRNRHMGGVKNGSRFIVFGPLAIISLCASVQWINTPNALFLARWYSFFLGVLVWAALERSVSAKWLIIYALAVGLRLIPLRSTDQFKDTIFWTVTVLLTGALIYAAGILGYMETWLSGRAIQFLGRISYSLYLIHLPVGATINSFGVRVCGNSNGLAFAWVCFSTTMSIGAAYLMYRYVERPAMRWSHHFKKKTSIAPSELTSPATLSVIAGGS